MDAANQSLWSTDLSPGPDIWESNLTDLQEGLERDRLLNYEAILGQITTGVFILEPTVRSDPYSLEVTVVNDMGVTFFGEADASCGVDVLREAEN